MANIKQRHHYITKYYLEGFCDHAGKIWTYKKIDPTKPFCNQPSDTAVISRFYHLKNNLNGINEIEDYFSDDIEAPASNAFKQLREKKFPSNSDREKLSLFFGTLMVRTPCYINHLNTEQSKQLNIVIKIVANDKENFYKTYKKIDPSINDNSIEIVRKSILDNKMPFESHRDILLKMMIHLGKTISLLLYNMKWALIETDDNIPFITSDNLINIFHPDIQPNKYYQPGLGMENTQVIIPISRKLALLLVNNSSLDDGTIFSVTNPQHGNAGGKNDLKSLVKSLNKTTYIKSFEYVFADSDSARLRRCFKSILRKAKRIEQSKMTDITVKNSK